MSKKRRRRLAQEAESHFFDVKAQAVKSTRGFELAFVGRFELLYREGEREMIVPLDHLKGRYLIELSRVDGWRPPHDDEALTPEHRIMIAENISAAMKRLRTAFEIDVP